MAPRPASRVSSGARRRPRTDSASTPGPEAHKKFNESAANRWTATVSKRGETTSVPFVQFDDLDRLHSAYSGRDDLVVDLADMKVQPDMNRSSQRVRFLRRGERVAYQNAFEIMDAASQQCLSVRDSDTGMGPV